MPSKMTNIDVLETSGVDHPAHLHEGFAVMKAANPETASAILRALGKEPTMTGQQKSATTGTPDTSAVEAAAAEAVQKAIDSKLQPILDKIAEGWSDLRAYGEQTDADTPSSAAPAADPAAPAAADVAAATELLKAAGAPEAVQAILKSLDERATAAESSAKEAMAKAAEERDKRLDQEAVGEFAKSYGNLALNAQEYGPALRRLALVDAAVHKSVTEMLTAQNAAQDGAGSLFQESGTAVTKSAGYRNVEARAQELVNSGQFDTIQKARAHVYETDPEAVASTRQEA